MITSIISAKNELLRVDHLIYVTLKYTRTVDVLKNTISRLLNFYDFFIQALAKKASEDGKIIGESVAPKALCENLVEIFKGDNTVVDAINFYLFLRKINRAPFEKESEYRRHVTLIANLDGNEERVDIDIITDYYKRAKELIEYVETTYGKK